ncbi:exodeoxyribonuclease VII large subunit [Actinospica sp. MGRD01-02]|uniref:Exodeoxyribonuclease 7 large subunit n=1 Tax=Actinospica acidithermotolerans TaxID=2828514 RepID=A0A941EL71_9ACTN|nr:exodeoxyribonuclease VII large subunit [Actinospica acidithermotolerans]MBR7831114.1 exodeoxyribonuclease VII large subunit [Actinospica acidithermotolerans]
MALESSFEAPVPVSTVATLVAQWIDRLGVVHVEGQITQISRRPGAGVVFLTLRDPAQDVSMSVTCMRSVYEQILPAPSEGQRVVIRAKPVFYRGRGQFSLQLQELRQVGVGELLARIEQLKAKLGAQGLFAPARKQPLPFLPQLIGLITGRASAAEKDVLENTRRRWPGVRFEVREVAVQGATAVPQVVGALKELDAHPEVDVIVIARGGGSVEDLLPFSDEQLLLAVAACGTPVVSAIGHEPDSPLLDLVADVRASTPTDAAKRIVPDVREEQERVRTARERMRGAVERMLEREERALANYRSRPSLAAPYDMIDRRELELREASGRMRRALEQRISRDSEVLGHTLARVRALSPLKTLERGYAIVQAQDGAVVRDAAEVAAGQQLGVRLAAGRLSVSVASATPEQAASG